MASKYHQPGDLGYLTYRAEATPGVIQTGARSWGGSSVSLKNDGDDQMEFIVLPDDRGYGATSRGPEKNGCTINFHSRGAGAWGNWKNFWCYYALGSVSGPTAQLPSFTLVVYNLSTEKYEIYTGCKVNKATITGQKPGAILEFSLEIFCIDHTIASGTAPPSSFAITSIQNITIGAAPTTPTESLLFWASNITVNMGGGGATTQYFQKWTLTIDNHLVRVEGVKDWYDGTKHKETVALFEEDRDMIFEGTLKLKGAEWDEYKKAGTAVTYVNIPIDTDNLTLSEGVIVPNTYSDRAQKAGEQTLTFRFSKNNLAF